MISSNDLGFTIDVEVAEAMPSSGHTAVYQNPPLSNVPMMGTSIGGIDSEEIGTLGLYIECTRKNGVKEIYALTCAHVAVPNLPCDLSGKSAKPCCFHYVENYLRRGRRIRCTRNRKCSPSSYNRSPGRGRCPTDPNRPEKQSQIGNKYS